MKRTAALMLAALTVALLAATCCVPASALDMSASTVNISSAADLIALAEYVNTHSENKNDYSATAGKTFVLTTDIDLNPGMDVTALKEGEKPVVWDGIRTFGGTFEGNSHTIKGLYNDGTFDYTTSDGAGLFRFVCGAVIRDLNVEKSYLKATQKCLGTVVGLIRTGGKTVIDNVHVNDVVLSAGGTFTGGIIGQVYTGKKNDLEAVVSSVSFNGVIKDGVKDKCDKQNAYGGLIGNVTIYPVLTITNATVSGYMHSGLCDIGIEIVKDPGKIVKERHCDRPQDSRYYCRRRNSRYHCARRVCRYNVASR